MSARETTIVLQINIAKITSALHHAINAERELFVMALEIINHNANALKITLEILWSNVVLSAMAMLIVHAQNLLVSMEVN